MMREECWKESWSLDAEKITHIQTSTGSQYLTSDRNFGTAHGSRGLPGSGNAKCLGCGPPDG